MERPMLRILAITGCLAFAGLIGVGPANSGSDLFSGKTITYIVATKAGGGDDAMGRVVAKYLKSIFRVRGLW